MDIKKVLDLHSKWLNNADGGQRADLCGVNLCGADLRGADLREVNLYGADLHGAVLYGANLRWANLREVDLYGADLRKADLRRADLREVDLRKADLREADLRCADLRKADLCGANLYRVDLHGADLRKADLRKADLREADLRCADLHEASLPDYQIVPEEGSFTAWKKTTNGVIKLLIPETAQRTSSLVGRKCRASEVIVLEGSGKSSIYTSNPVEYKQGETVKADSFDPDVRVECTHGIHFYLTRKEAENA